MTKIIKVYFSKFSRLFTIRQHYGDTYYCTSGNQMFPCFLPQSNVIRQRFKDNVDNDACLFHVESIQIVLKVCYQIVLDRSSYVLEELLKMFSGIT